MGEEEMTMTRFPFVLVMLGLVGASPALAADVVEHSGRIVAIDMATHTLTLEEIGPWRGEKTRPVTHSIEFGPGTMFELVTRAKGANPQGWIGGYVESAVMPSTVRSGDFATVTLDRRGKGREAATVQVVQLEGVKG
jgi:hypothetical protein